MTISHTNDNAGARLAAILWPADETQARLLRGAVLAVFGTLILYASAKVNVPMWPVPMSMQTFAVMVLAMAYGFRLGTATILLYLLEGALGLPVFANTPERGIGLAYMAGPTGGYLAGFVVCAAVVGWLADRGWDRNLGMILIAYALGTAAIFGLGIAWLSVLIGLDKALTAGLVPFIPGAVLKIALAAGLMSAIWRILDKRAR
ncbi:MAG: biotin transporter BioY [Rhodospirillaceae bacterium]|jgi:biotin transport system substrate-specific component|nr:biotin transporter BioY [Rhodospirillaceae bacterium]